jgi:hypothetical protein
VRIEAVLAISVLVAVAVLTQLEPPRAAAQAQNLNALASSSSPSQIDRGYIQKNAEVSGLIMVLRVSPGKIGENQFELGLGSEFGGIGEVQDVRLDFENKGAATGQSRLALPLSGSAKFSAKAANLSLPGDWTITAIIRRRGLDDVRQAFDVPVAKAQGGGTSSTAATTSDSIWDWPFSGARSFGAIAALIVGAIVALAVGVWQYRELRESR